MFRLFRWFWGLKKENEARMEDETKVRDALDGLVQETAIRLRKRDLDRLDGYRRVEVGLAIKGMKSWRALAHLFFNGFEEASDVLLRTLVDTVVDMRFISIEPTERAQRFIDYKAAHDWRWLREAKERAITISPEEFKAIEAALDREHQDVFRRHPEWKTKPPIAWASQNTADKVDAIGDRLMYMAFMMGSKQTHPNAVALEGYFFQNEEGKADFKLDPAMPEDERPFIAGCIFLSKLIRHLDQVMDLDLGNAWSAADTALNELIRKKAPEVAEQVDRMNAQAGTAEGEGR